MLAVQAMKAARTPEALDALRQGLTESRVRATLPGSRGARIGCEPAPAGDAAVAATSDGKARTLGPELRLGSDRAVGAQRSHRRYGVQLRRIPRCDRELRRDRSRLDRRGWLRAWLALRGHEGAVNDAAFSPDGALVVTGGEDGTVRVWNARTGHQVLQLKGHQRPVYDVSFNLDGAWIVSASDDDTARIWDAKTGNVLQVLRGHEDGLYTAAFDAGGDRVVTASQDGTAKVWNVATGRLVADLVGHQAPVATASFSPDGRSIVTASEDQTARSGSQVRTSTPGSPRPPGSAQLGDVQPRWPRDRHDEPGRNGPGLEHGGRKPDRGPPRTRRSCPRCGVLVRWRACRHWGAGWDGSSLGATLGGDPVHRGQLVELGGSPRRGSSRPPTTTAPCTSRARRASASCGPRTSAPRRPASRSAPTRSSWCPAAPMGWVTSTTRRPGRNSASFEDTAAGTSPPTSTALTTSSPGARTGQRGCGIRAPGSSSGSSTTEGTSGRPTSAETERRSSPLGSAMAP